MRITYFAPPIEKGHGGVTIMLEQIKYLRSQGVDVELTVTGKTTVTPDIAIATFWPTAYLVQKSEARLKGYLVQHDESVTYGIDAYNTYQMPWDFAITISSWLNDFMKNRTKSHLFIMGTDPLLFHPHPNKYPKQVLFFFSRSVRKNWEIGIDALRIIKEKRNDIRTVTFDMNPLDRSYDFIDIHIVAVPYEEMSKLYSESTVYMQSTLYEGFGGPVMEAIASGTMVVTPDREGNKDFDTGFIDYVSPYDSEEIANHCIYWIDHPEERKKRELQGIKKVKNFTWEKAGKKLLKFLKTL